jgi:nucleoid DNA-binding protein
MKPISIKEMKTRWGGNAVWIKDFSSAVAKVLAEGKAVNLPGVGTLYPATRAARRKKCGLTGEVLDWPEVRTVKFRVSEVVKRELNKA